MSHFGARSAKPQKGWCNNRAFVRLDLGPYRRALLADKQKAQTVRKSISKNGKKSYTGTKELKQSQFCPYLIQCVISSMDNLVDKHPVGKLSIDLSPRICTGFHIMPAQELPGWLWECNLPAYPADSIWWWGVPWSGWINSPYCCVWCYAIHNMARGPPRSMYSVPSGKPAFEIDPGMA